MKNKTVIKVGSGMVLSAAMLLGFATSAFAQTGTISASVSAKTKLSQSSLVTKADTAIDKRVSDLTDLETNIATMKNVSSSQIASMTASIEAQKTDLANLKAKIAADTDMTTLRTDIKSITADNRTYALIIPQARILLASDKATTITGMLTAIGTKLQSRVSGAQTSGKDVTALTSALVDFNAKLSDATSLSASIPTAISGLVPDNGDKTVMASNEAALKAARANLAAIAADLKAARADMKTIIAGVKGVGASAGSDTSMSASATTTAQ